MKNIIAFLLFCLPVSTLKAQSFSEWFRQGSTQKKYLTEQIAALQVYIGFAKDGYKAVGKGLQTIGQIKDGDFNLHNLYFSSLKAVNPEVAKYPKALDILSIQQYISETISRSKVRLTASGQFSQDEMAYIRGVYERLSVDCSQTLSDLEQVTTPGKLEMKDDERLARIDRLFADSQSQYHFAKNYSASLQVMAAQKARDKNEIENLQKLHATK